MHHAEEYFKTLEVLSTGSEGEIRKIKYTDPNGYGKIVECRLKNDKIEFKISDQNRRSLRGYLDFFS